MIEPLRVVDDTQQRTLLGDLREQTSTPLSRPGTGPGQRRRSARTRSAAPHAAAPAASGAHPAAERTADAGWRTPAPSRTRRPRRARPRGPSADSTRYSSSAVFPIPGSPVSTNDRLSPRRMSSINPSSSRHSRPRPSRPLRLRSRFSGVDAVGLWTMRRWASRPGGLEGGDRQRVGELSARADPELGEDVAQVPLDGARAEEQARADLGVREPVAGELGDLALLGGQLVARLGAAPARRARPSRPARRRRARRTPPCPSP